MPLLRCLFTYPIAFIALPGYALQYRTFGATGYGISFRYPCIPDFIAQRFLRYCNPIDKTPEG